MPTLPPAASPGQPVEGQSLAVLAESLYLANLLVAPGLAFAWLWWLWMKHHDTAPALARQHLRQAARVSLVGGVLIVGLSGLLLLLGGLHAAWTWVAMLTYFVCIHGALVLAGMMALAKAMAGKTWRYPLIGPRDA